MRLTQIIGDAFSMVSGTEGTVTINGKVYKGETVRIKGSG